MKKGILKWLATLAGIFFLAACINREKSGTAEDGGVISMQDYEYVSVYYEKIADDDAFERVYACRGNVIYTFQNEFFYHQQEITIDEIPQRVEEYDQFVARSRVYYQTFENSGLSKKLKAFELEGHIICAQLSAEGDLVLVMEDAATYLGLADDRSLIKVDHQGKVLFRTELDQGCYPEKVVVDGTGNVYVLSQGLIRMFRKNGKPGQKITLTDTVLDVASDEKEGIYISCMEMGTQIKKIQDGKEVPVRKETEGLYDFATSAKGGFLVRNATKAYFYSLKEDAWQEAFDFVDLNLNSNDVLEWWIGDDGKIYFITKEQKTLERWLLIADLRHKSDAVTKKVITVGVWGSSDELSRAVVGFNRSQEEYQVKIINYAEMLHENGKETSKKEVLTRLRLEFLTGEGPDLISMGVMDLGELSEKGMMEDLKPFLEKSESMSEEDFFQGALNSATRDGKIIYLPRTFWLQTLIGKDSVLKGRDSYDLKELIRLWENHPQSILLFSSTKDMEGDEKSFLKSLLLLEQYEIFGLADSKEKESILRSALDAAKATYETRIASDDELQVMYREEKILLKEEFLYQFTNLTFDRRTYFGKEGIRIIGYPAGNGKSHHVMQPSEGFGILSFSKQKEGAWEFIEYWILNSDPKNIMAFLAKKDMFCEQLNHAVEYALQEDSDIGSSTFDKDDLLLIKQMAERAIGSDAFMDEEVINIIDQEIRPYLFGEKEADDVVEIICNRVDLFMKED